MSDNSTTFGWLVYLLEEGRPKFLGLYQTREAAEGDIAALASVGDERVWVVEAVAFVGWGYAAPGVFSQNGAPPLRVVK